MKLTLNGQTRSVRTSTSTSENGKLKATFGSCSIRARFGKRLCTVQYPQVINGHPIAVIGDRIGTALSFV